MNIYKDYAEYYDLLYADKDYLKEACFVSKVLSKYSKGKGTILELGCGTGIHATELVKRGFLVDGIDSSKVMLESAKNRFDYLPTDLKKNLSFSYGDIRKYRNKKKYDSVVSLFHVTSYMTTNKHLNAMFDTANFHLNKNGIFMFDCWYGPAVLTIRPKKKNKIIENEKIKIVRTAIPEMRPNENIVDVNYDINFIDKHTKTINKIKEIHSVRYFFMPEIIEVLKFNNFDLIDACELISKKKPGFETWGVCFIAKKS